MTTLLLFSFPAPNIIKKENDTYCSVLGHMKESGQCFHCNSFLLFYSLKTQVSNYTTSANHC